MQQQSQPIGIFDSGVGGLTIARAVHNALPHENIIYIGDTAHAPWGDKSRLTVAGYIESICKRLIDYNCKVIVSACNTASCIAQSHLDKIAAEYKTPIINVIDPLVEYIANSNSKNIGIIGTKQTIASATYTKRLQFKGVDAAINSLATPLLVPLIEEGFVNSTVMRMVLQHYLSNSCLDEIDTLVLGCTHYPIIKSKIMDYYDDKVQVIDSAVHTANNLVQFLRLKSLQNTSGKKANIKFNLTDNSIWFKDIANKFFTAENPHNSCTIEY